MNHAAKTKYFPRKKEKSRIILEVILQKLTLCRNIVSFPVLFINFFFFLCSFPIFSQYNSYPEEEGYEEYNEKIKIRRETMKRVDLFNSNYAEYYNKYHYPIALPEVTDYVVIFGYQYKTIVENHFNEPIKFESCYIASLPGYSRSRTDLEIRQDKRLVDLANAECQKKNQKSVLSRNLEIHEDAIQKVWRRSNCKNPDLLALIDFKNYLYKDDKLYRACIQLKDPLDEINYIRTIKKQIFDFIREPVLEYPEKFKNLTEDENFYAKEIHKLSVELLIEYANFESYSESLSAIENPQYLNHDIIFDVIYPPDRLIILKNLYSELRGHRYRLLVEELYKGKERGAKLLSFNKKIISEIKIANEKIQGNNYISKSNKNEFNKVLECIEGLSEKHLEKLGLSYYSGLFKKYSINEFVPEKKELISKEFFEILNLYNNNFFKSKLLELRLLNRKKNCEMVRSLPIEEVSFTNMIKNTCELNTDTLETCKYFK